MVNLNDALNYFSYYIKYLVRGLKLLLTNKTMLFSILVGDKENRRFSFYI